jgi:hypothetical protein
MTSNARPVDGARIVTREIPVELIHDHPENYNFHPDEQVERLALSHSELGQYRSIVVWEQRDGTFLRVAGHGYSEGAQRAGATTLRCEVLPVDTPSSTVKAIMLADNLHATGSEPDDQALARLLAEQRDAGFSLEALGSSDDLLAALLEELDIEEPGADVERPARGTQPNPRQLPIDVIYTLQMADCTCCLAAQAGLKYGIQSAHYRLCPYRDELSGRHTVTFIDNDYFHYDHAVHLAAVRELRPKYATVRDIMTREQCREAGIDYFSLEQILAWAEELAASAENVIVIPKYDCIDQIPERFMLGYSIPTSHGGTPLPAEAFRGRRVHLLGGSWSDQLAYLAQLGDDVVSLDNNAIQMIASRFGNFVMPDGETMQLQEIGLGELANPRYVALAISFGNIASKINELYRVTEEQEEHEERPLNA